MVATQLLILVYRYAILCYLESWGVIVSCGNRSVITVLCLFACLCGRYVGGGGGRGGCGWVFYVGGWVGGMVEGLNFSFVFPFIFFPSTHTHSYPQLFSPPPSLPPSSKIFLPAHPSYPLAHPCPSPPDLLLKSAPSPLLKPPSHPILPYPSPFPTTPLLTSPMTHSILIPNPPHPRTNKVSISAPLAFLALFFLLLKKKKTPRSKRQ